MPFADCPREEAERWLRILRLHGTAGRALTGLGIGETPMMAPAVAAAGDAATSTTSLGAGTVDRVTADATRIAAERGGCSVGTSDVLLAVMDAYGAEFARILDAYGTGRDEVIERLATGVLA